MNKHKLFNKAFTIIELLVIIVVIGILASVGIVSYSKVQMTARDSKRSASINSIAAALETYYNKNGEYPSCSMMSQSSEYVSSTVLSGSVTKDTLSSPTASSGNNSIQAACADLTALSGDLYSYVGDSSSSCTSGSSCSRYVLKYKEDSTGNIITLKSRYGIDKSFVVTWGGANAENASTVTKTSDGGYVMVGETNSFGVGGNDAFISKFNSNGVLLWSKSWGSAVGDYSCAVIESPDGGIVVSGFSYGLGTGSVDAYIAKYAADGTYLWSRSWGGTNDDRAYSLKLTADGGYIMGGYTVSYGVGNGDAFLAKFNSNGDLSWSRIFGGGGVDYVNSINQDKAGDYIVVGDVSTAAYSAGDYDGFIAKISANGNLVWFKSIGGAGLEALKSSIINPDGTIVALGYTDAYGSGGRDGYLIKFDSSGDVIWLKAIGGSQEDQYRSIITTIDGGFAIMGHTRSYGVGDADVILSKFSKEGDLTWSKTFGGPLGDYGWSVFQSDDAGYVMSGYTWNNTAGSYDGVLIKMMSDGSILNCTSAMCRTVSVGVTPIALSSISRNATNSAVTAGSMLISPTVTAQNATSRITVPL